MLSHGMLESGLSGSQENIIFISEKDVGVTIIHGVPTVEWLVREIMMIYNTQSTILNTRNLAKKTSELALDKTRIPWTSLLEIDHESMCECLYDVIRDSVVNDVAVKKSKCKAFLMLDSCS